MQGRLIVENFGPLKKVDIQLNDLLVLIGPQSGGKSTIAKLIAIINELATGVSQRRRTVHISKTALSTLLNKFNINWNLDGARITYNAPEFQFSVIGNEISYKIFAPFNELSKRNHYPFIEDILEDLQFLFERTERRIKDFENELNVKNQPRANEKMADLWVYDIRKLLNEIEFVLDRVDEFDNREKNGTSSRYRNLRNQLQRYRIWLDITKNNEKSDIEPINVREIVSFLRTTISGFKTLLSNKEIVYIPAERMLTSIASGAFYNLQKNDVPLPECLIDFGANFETSRSRLQSYKIKELGITYRYENNQDVIELGKNNKIQLKEGSSGFQAMIPMAVVIEYFSKEKQKQENTENLFIIEEPELNLYPTTQQDLVSFVAERCIGHKNSLVVTTHSPYVLSSISNLIKANEVAAISPADKEKVKKVVPERYWVEYKKTNAYYIKNGISKNILDKELKTIDFSKIDDVSDKIGDVFDRLLSIQFDK